MPSLLEFQRSFRRALLTDDVGIATLIGDEGLSAEERLDVHRNNVVSSLTAVLKDTFPAVCRLVDERFFAYAADAFLRAHPPARPCLAEYGADFPNFLAAFPPCRELVYLADVARLEWLAHEASLRSDQTSLLPSALAEVRAEETPRLMLQLQPSTRYFRSRWPVDRIWTANRPDAASEATADLDAGGADLQVRRAIRGVEVRPLPAGTFEFRRALWTGQRLGDAADAALGCDPTFDLATAFADLFREGLVVGFALDPDSSPETTS